MLISTLVIPVQDAPLGFQHQKFSFKKDDQTRTGKVVSSTVVSWQIAIRAPKRSKFCFCNIRRNSVLVWHNFCSFSSAKQSALYNCCRKLHVVWWLYIVTFDWVTRAVLASHQPMTGQVLSAHVAGKVMVKCWLSGMPDCKFGINDKVVMEAKGKTSSSDPSRYSPVI